MIQPVFTSAGTLPARDGQEAVLMAKAKELEAAFLAEILSFSGLGEVSEEFGGGVGEGQFASFLRTEQARNMVDRGGIGLSQMIFESLKAKAGPSNDAP